MDLEKTLSNLRDGLFSIGGFGEKDITNLSDKMDGMLQAAGIDQSSFAIGLLGLAGALLVCLIVMVVRRSSQEAHVASHGTYEDDRIIALEQVVHDLKSQLAMVKGQLKADFGYLRQEVGEIRESISSDSSVEYDTEDRSMAING